VLMPFEIMETIKMIQEENLDIRTITMPIQKRQGTKSTANLVKVGEDIEKADFSCGRKQ